MNNEMSDFVKLVIERMDTFPEEFMNQGPNFRWQVLTSGIVDLVIGDPTTSAARSLWALEPHELEAVTTKFKAIYLEQQKRAFLKNILIGDETKSKKINIVKRSGPLTAADITRESLAILEKEWKNVDSNLGHSNNTNAYEYEQKRIEPRK
jgi:hypothetical protein